MCQNTKRETKVQSKNPIKSARNKSAIKKSKNPRLDS